ncbi:MAG TPA: hypothetical protein VKR06_47090 [Ktedonosporobacter sp.]|nr:hypothetical protein [Ktedonosporobacter sp.]
MPKAKGRKKVSSAYTQPAQKRTHVEQISEPANTATVRRPAQTPLRTSQGLFMAALVALGCWGLAASFFFFTTDPNHYLFGGMAALMALMWSFSFAVRLRKILQQK